MTTTSSSAGPSGSPEPRACPSRSARSRATATPARRRPTSDGAHVDIDLAEDAVQDAFTVAVERWPRDGMPPSPAGWIITTARRRAIDRLRREATRAARHTEAL